LTLKNQVEASTEYVNLEMSLDSMGLLNVIKKLVYTTDTNDLNVQHNKVMAHMKPDDNISRKFQDIQEFRDQYMAMRK